MQRPLVALSLKVIGFSRGSANDLKNELPRSTLARGMRFSLRISQETVPTSSRKLGIADLHWESRSRIVTKINSPRRLIRREDQFVTRINFFLSPAASVRATLSFRFAGNVYRSIYPTRRLTRASRDPRSLRAERRARHCSWQKERYLSEGHFLAVNFAFRPRAAGAAFPRKCAVGYRIRVSMRRPPLVMGMYANSVSPARSRWKSFVTMSLEIIPSTLDACHYHHRCRF